MILSDISKANKEMLEQKLGLRVRLFKGWAQETVVSGVAFASGVATLSGARWVRRVVPTFDGGAADLKVWFSHDGVSFQWWHTFVGCTSGTALDFPITILCRYLKVKKLALDGSESDVTGLSVHEEDMFDITSHVRDGVSIERAKDRELGFYTMPRVTLPLDNTQRYFSRRNSLSPYWDVVHQVHHCRANAQFLIETIYRGPDGALPIRSDGEVDWLPQITFRAENFSNNPEAKLVTVTGSGGKELTKTRTTQPMHEVVTPLELTRDWLIRSDSDRRLLIPLNPSARQKTESVHSEYVGKARSFGTNWSDLISLTHAGLITVNHPGYWIDDSDGKAASLATAQGQLSRMGMCTDGKFIYALLHENVDGPGNLCRMYIEKISFQGEVLKSLRVTPVGETAYVQDLTTDGEFIYFCVNGPRVDVVNEFTYQDVKKVDVDLAGPITTIRRFSTWTSSADPVYALYGITYASEGPFAGNLVIAWQILQGGTWNAAQGFMVMTLWGTVINQIQDLSQGLPRIEYLDVVGGGKSFLLHWKGEPYIHEIEASRLNTNWTHNMVSHPLALPDYGGPIFVTARSVHLVRQNLGVGRVAAFGWWLENGNIQRSGVPGSDEVLLYPQPLLTRDGQLLDPAGTVTDGILETSDYVLNLRTGELNSVVLFPDESRIHASYDHKYTLQYVRVEDQNRLEVLNDVAISNNFMLYLNETNELQFRDRRYEESIVCSDGETSVANKRLGDTYQAGGLLFIVQKANPAYAFDTVRVYSTDRVRVFVPGVDYEVSYSGERYFISFNDTDTVHECKVAIVRYRVQQEIPVLRDVRHVVQGGVDEQWGDRDLVNDVTVEGERMLPEDTSVAVEQVFAVSPNEMKQSSRFANVQQVESSGQFDWNPAEKVVDSDSKPDAERRYFIEFEQPFVLGTSGFDVLYGDARDGGPSGGNGEYGILMNGTQNHGGQTNTARFYKVTLPVTARESNYNIILDNNKEWRVATGSDFEDMADNTEGGEPVNVGDVRKTTHFYLKQMNGNYGMRPTRFVAYFPVLVRYFVDRDGRVIEDAAFTPEDPRNPFSTASPKKRLRLLLTPEDERQNPLFPLHSTSGQDGYYADNTGPEGFDYFVGVLPEFSLRIRKVQADMLGVNFDYDSWSAVTHFVRVATTGYPLTVIEKFYGIAPASNTDLELYGLREKSWQNSFIQNISASRNIARYIKALRSDEPGKFSVDVLYDAGITLDMLVRVIESFDGIDELFEVAQETHTLNVSGASVTRLGLEREV